MEGVGGLRYPGCSHEDVPLSVQVGGSMCVYRPAIAAISIKHRVTMPHHSLLSIWISTYLHSPPPARLQTKSGAGRLQPAAQWPVSLPRRQCCQCVSQPRQKFHPRPQSTNQTHILFQFWIPDKQHCWLLGWISVGV